MTKYEIFSLVASLTALVIAIIALARTHRLTSHLLKKDQSESHTASQTISAIAADKVSGANTAIDVTLRSHGDGYQFVIRNIGGSEAKNVNFSIEGETNPLIEKEYNKKIPIASLTPGKSLKLSAEFSLGEPREYATIVSWVNLDGSEGNNRFYVSA